MTLKTSTGPPATALRFVLLVGAVNLFADVTAEGARSIVGIYLAQLGASAFATSCVAGFGEFLGCAMRWVSGRWPQRSRLFAPATLAGYVVQMAAVPGLGLVGSWPHAAALILAERAGRATRDLPDDALPAEPHEHRGRGWRFFINAALNQGGAVIGPLAVSAILFWYRDAHPAFFYLGFPAAITLAFVFGFRVAAPDAGRVLRKLEPAGEHSYPAAFWWYLGAA